MIRQCSSCGGFCKRSGCERENIKPAEREWAMQQMVAENQKLGLYDSPKREWVGLTDDDYEELLETKDWGGSLIHAVEAKLKEKNCG